MSVERGIFLVLIAWIIFKISAGVISFIVFLLLAMALFDRVGLKYCFLFMLVISMSYVLNKPATLTDLCGTIIDIREKVTFLRIGKVEYSMFDQKQLSLDDQICVIGKVVLNKSGSTFVSDPILRWANQRNHGGSINVESIEIISKGNTFKSRLFDRINITDASGWLKAYLFGHPAPINGDFTSLFVSGGLIASSLTAMIRNILGYFFTEKVRRWMMSSILVLIWLFWGGSFVLMRLFLSDLSRYLNIKPLGRVSLTYLCLLCIYPHHLTHPAFVIPLTLSLINVFGYPRFLSRMAILPLILTILTYRFDFVSALLFPILRIIAMFGYLFAWLCTLLPLLIPHFIKFCEILSIHEFEAVTKLRLTGHPSIIFSIIWVMVLFSKRLSKKQLIIKTIVLIAVFQMSPYLNPFVTVTFFNVAQADSALIQLPYNQGNWLIDTGRTSTSALLRANLWYRGISHLDAVFISHQDSDHSGGLAMLMRDFSINEIIRDATDYHHNGYIMYSLMDVEENLNDNDNSLVHLFSINGLTYLFLGDISKSREVELVRKYPFLQADVVKLAHHGSKTSTSVELIASTQPRLTIISADPRLYGHPHKETLKTLWQFQIPTLSTYLNGDIRISTLGNFHFVMSSSGGFGIMKTVIK
jgi:competence protein ComEC